MIDSIFIYSKKSWWMNTLHLKFLRTMNEMKELDILLIYLLYKITNYN